MNSTMKRKLRRRLVCAVANAPGYQMLIKEAVDRFGVYKQYPQSMSLSMTFLGDVHIKYHHKDWPDSTKESVYRVGLQPTLVIKPEYTDDFMKNLKLNIARMIVDQILNACEFKDLYEHHRIDQIFVDDVIRHSDGDVWCNHHWQDMIVWSSETVSIWHIEQECGEGWITLPLKPDMLQCTVIYNNV